VALSHHKPVWVRTECACGARLMPYSAQLYPEPGEWSSQHEAPPGRPVRAGPCHD